MAMEKDHSTLRFSPHMASMERHALGHVDVELVEPLEHPPTLSDHTPGALPPEQLLPWWPGFGDLTPGREGQ